MSKATEALSGYEGLLPRGAASASSVSAEPLAPTQVRLRLRRLEGLGAWLLWACDMGVAALAWEGAWALREALSDRLGPLLTMEQVTGRSAWLALLVFLAAYSASLYLAGCYATGRAWWTVRKQLHALVAAVLVFLVVSYFLRWFNHSRAFLLLLPALLAAGALLEWVVFSAVRRLLRPYGLGHRRVLVVGSPRSAAWVLHDLAGAAAGYRLLGLLTDADNAAAALKDDAPGVRTFRGVARAARVAARTHAEEVVLCLPDWPAKRMVHLLQELWPLGVRVHVLSPELSVYLRRIEVPQTAFQGLALIDFGRSPMVPHGLPWKRLEDIVLAFLLGVLGVPVWLVIALGLWITQGRPVLYWQERVGPGGKRFRMLKFRTMRPGAEAEQEELLAANEAVGPIFKIRDDPRVTPLGRLLRRHSLDEIPQLWNVLCGDMTLVGPRPPLPGEVAYYEPWHHLRLAGVVGCSGLWQVSGRSDLPFDEMAMLDIYYLHNMTPRLDLRILVRTVWAVLIGKGAY